MAASAVKTRSRSVSARRVCTDWPVWTESTDSISARMRTTSSAARIMSGIVPRPDADGWCSTTRACGRMPRRPGVPAASSTAPAAIASPTHVVTTGALMYCIVSYTASVAIMSPPSQLM